MKNLSKSFSINNTYNKLTQEQKSTITHDIEIINYKRIKLFFIILLIVLICFICFNDIPELINNPYTGLWSDKGYFIMHMLLLALAIAGISIISVLIKRYSTTLAVYHTIVIPVLVNIMLVLTSALDVLDRIKTGIGSSIYIANTLILASIILIKYPINIFVYILPFVTFIGELFIFENTSIPLYTNAINASIFFAAAIFISKITYSNEYNYMAEKMLLTETNKKLDYMSNHDPLTGLSNRRNFQIQAEHTMKAANESCQKAALVLIDIDHFKYINDKFGHPIGDLILKEISNILIKNLRETDLAVRWGGEEFLLLLFPCSMDEAFQLSDQIRAVIENKALIVDKLQINITASFGISKLSGSFSTSFDTSYKLADKALYQAKCKGRNRVIIGS